MNIRPFLGTDFTEFASNIDVVHIDVMISTVLTHQSADSRCNSITHVACSQLVHTLNTQEITRAYDGSVHTMHTILVGYHC